MSGGTCRSTNVIIGCGARVAVISTTWYLSLYQVLRLYPDLDLYQNLHRLRRYQDHPRKFLLEVLMLHWSQGPLIRFHLHVHHLYHIRTTLYRYQDHQHKLCPVGKDSGRCQKWRPLLPRKPREAMGRRLGLGLGILLFHGRQRRGGLQPRFLRGLLCRHRLLLFSL